MIVERMEQAKKKKLQSQQNIYMSGNEAKSIKKKKTNTNTNTNGKMIASKNQSLPEIKQPNNNKPKTDNKSKNKAPVKFPKI